MPTPIPIGPATTLTEYHGYPVDLVMKQFLQRCEIQLGFLLTLLQGYNPGNIKTSFGTHSYGVVDLAPLRAAEKLHVWAQLGGWIWHRDEVDGLWQEHCHGGIRNHPGLSASAQAQQVDWDGNPPRSGLKGHVIDNAVLDYRPASPVQFTYDPKWDPTMPALTKVQEARNDITDAATSLGSAVLNLHDADPSREAARAERAELRVHKQALEKMLDRMPQK